MPPLKIVHFSDILCIWAHVSQSSLCNLIDEFGDRLEVDVRFCSVFPDSHGKIEKIWKDRGGFEGYAAHVRDVAKSFDEIDIHPDAWFKVRPKSSASPQLFVKSLELLEAGAKERPFQERLTFRAAAALRSAFFSEAKDISDWSVQKGISEQLEVDFKDVCAKIESGEAIAHLAADYEMGQTMHVRGSPTYILNQGRQILYGNISYRVLYANVSELLAEQQEVQATPC